MDTVGNNVHLVHSRDAFAMYWRANRDKYRLYFQSIMTLPNHNTHDTGDMAKAHEWGCNMSRGLLAAIFGSDPRTTDNRLVCCHSPVHCCIHTGLT